MRENIIAVEDVFVTEGVPEVTFVKPPNYLHLLSDIRREGKPVIVEGQSGTGKTTAVKRILAEIFPKSPPRVLTPREPKDLPVIENITEATGAEIFIIDDFHRLKVEVKERLADLAKVIAERDDRQELPKLVIIGINDVGSDLIRLVPDVAKRVGIHRIEPGSAEQIAEVIRLGEEKLNIRISDSKLIYEESRGDYWLTQQICKTICLSAGVAQACEPTKEVQWEPEDVRKQTVAMLQHNFDAPVREFCRGRRFRPSNDPYYKLLKAISGQDKSNIDLNELANSRPDIKGSINNIKDHRLRVLLDSKEGCAKLFYYDHSTKNFALEDPALFFYLKYLNWDDLRQRCGFRDGPKDFEFDLAISFAGENRVLAEFMVKQFAELDISCFYDRHYEDNYLGGLWSQRFKEVFTEASRLVVALLDRHHHIKVWPTFERDCFDVRVPNGEVIPVHLDDTVFVGIPKDTVGIHFKFNGDLEQQHDAIIDDVVLRVAAKLDNL